MNFKIREARKRAGLTQKQLAEKLGVSESTLSGYETGKSDPQSVTLALIATICDVSVDYLMDREKIEFTKKIKLDEKEATDLLIAFSSLTPAGKELVQAAIEFAKKYHSGE